MFKLDTGAQANIISDKLFRSVSLPNSTLEKTGDFSSCRHDTLYQMQGSSLDHESYHSFYTTPALQYFQHFDFDFDNLKKIKVLEVLQSRRCVKTVVGLMVQGTALHLVKSVMPARRKIILQSIVCQHYCCTYRIDSMSIICNKFNSGLF
jgi:hypothetical protein